MRLVCRSCSVAVLLTSAAPTATLAQLGLIEGVVSNTRTGGPVPQARVSIVGTVRWVLANANGYFVIDDVRPGTYQLRATAPAFTSSIQPDVLAKPGTRTIVRLELKPTDEWVAPTAEPIEDEPRVPSLVVQPGVGVGGSVGLDGLGGANNGPIESGAGFEAFLRVGVRPGLFLHGGAHFGNHGIERASQGYTLTGLFVEPRFVALSVSHTWAPFITARASHFWEATEAPTVSLRASGYSLGGGGGVLVRLAEQVAAEVGLAMGTARFGAYTFQGEGAWKNCLDALAPGTPLPESTVQCTSARSPGGGAFFCYPPYFPENTSSCTPPKIPYADTGRDATWFRVWFGLNLSLASPRE